MINVSVGSSKFNHTGIYNNILETIGGTPMVRLNNIAKAENIECELLAKCEFFNSGGSVKDRIAKEMLEKALEDGTIKPGYTIIEPTSGNTGIGLALNALLMGLKMIAVIPEKMSNEKIAVLKALGAQVIRTPTSAEHDSPESHISVAYALNKKIPNSWIPNQYDNQNNWKAHYKTTGQEILRQCDYKIDVLVCGAGTGGTITGVSKKLKEEIPGLKVVGVDPLYGSILANPDKPLTPEENKPYLVEGIGYDFVPNALDRSLVDEWIKVSDESSFEMARKLISLEGILCGGSSGSSVYAAIQVAKQMKKGQRLVVIIPDSIRNYITKHLDPNWLIYNNLKDADYSDLKNTKMGEKLDSSLTASVLDDMLCPVIDVSEPIISACRQFSMSNLSYLAVIEKSTPFEPQFVINKEMIIKSFADGKALTGKVSDLEKYAKDSPELSSPSVVKYDTPLSDVIKKIEKDKFVIIAPKTVSKNFPSLRMITDANLINFVSKYKVDIAV